jgi:hypothetical protein
MRDHPGDRRDLWASGILKGCKSVAGGRAKRYPRNTSRRECTLEGCKRQRRETQSGSTFSAPRFLAPLPGCKDPTKIRWYRFARPPATFCEPSGFRTPRGTTPSPQPRRSGTGQMQTPGVPGGAEWIDLSPRSRPRAIRTSGPSCRCSGNRDVLPFRRTRRDALRARLLRALPSIEAPASRLRWRRC